MSTIITWHGHSNFQIQHTSPSGTVNIIIDPFFGPTATTTWDAIDAPDLVLVTHDHGDHVGSAIELCQKHPSTMLASVVGTAESLATRGVPAAQVLNGIGFNIGGTLVHNGVAITMTQAFHSSETSVPVGYIITLPNGYTIYHAGDTGIFASMETLGKLYPIDLALLPTGGLFTMDARQAATACELLQAKAVIPMHWGTFPVLAQSTDDFAAALAPNCSMHHVAIGTGLEL